MIGYDLFVAMGQLKDFWEIAREAKLRSLRTRIGAVFI